MGQETSDGVHSSPIDMSVNKHVQAYTAKRVVLSSPRPIEQVVADIHEATNKEKEGHVAVLLATAKDREGIERGMDALTEGKRSFLFVPQLVPIS